MSEPRPISPPDVVTAPFWDATRDHRLVFERCPACRTIQHYPRGFCAACGRGEVEWTESKGAGTIVSHTTVHRAPHPAFTAPYVVALVRLDEGPVLLTNVIGDARCDARVSLVWEDLPDGRALPMFVPTEG